MAAANDLSLADAKLARQLKRNEKAEATLTAPIAERQNSRGKNKIWKHLDMSVDMPREEGGVSLSQADSRVNDFRPMTRDSSLSRSLSSLSQHTTGTLQSESGRERHDSTAAEGGGFQLIRGRRSRKHNSKLDSQLNLYEAKSEERQKTVEAAPDTKEIYHVFGNPPPPPTHLETNPGSVNGQLQFIQHTNGDISAHQWSSSSFEWQNIGQFSNIRKKIEGQLTSNRLKGETAYQTLQQNTLAYFRTIAKQKEADVMGLPFGPKEIHQLMPELRAMQPTAVTPKKSITASEAPILRQPLLEATVEHSEDHSFTAESHHRMGNGHPYYYESYPAYTGVYGSYPLNTNNHYNYGGHVYYHPSAELQYDRHAVPQGFDSMKTQDPFYLDASSSMYHAKRGNASSSADFHHQRLAPANYTSYPHSLAAAHKQVNMNYYHQSLPPEAALPNEEKRQKGYFGGASMTQGGPENTKARLRGSAASWDGLKQPASSRGDENVVGGHALLGAEENRLQVSASNTCRPSLGYLAADCHASSTEDASSAKRSKAVTPLSTSRSAIKDQLYKISDQAKERNLSQSNIRTVLFDPFRSSSDTDNSAQSAMHSQQAASEIKRTVANPSGLPPSAQKEQQTPYEFDSSMRRNAVDFGHIGDARNGNLRRPMAPPENAFLAGLREAQAKGKRAHLFGKGVKLGGMDIEMEADEKFLGNQGAKMGREYDLKAWWSNGNTFSRHEELYQSLIKASALASPPTIPVPGTTASSFASIGKSSPNEEASASGSSLSRDSMTRMLIPVLENLSYYVEGPAAERDYFSRWAEPPEWAIDHSPSGNKSFYDKEAWGQPPVRIGRDPRYRPLPMESGLVGLRFGGFGSPQRVPVTGSGLAVGSGRFSFGMP
ncbi:hypothetical protein KC318_g1524 [Hortaea werneckii]|uniref:Uncharacterized protein n=2 Tax=Hortaea werneckii TaxID=91943 RepID=A0A3M6Z4U6_HORWE|nr:hypothetical protein KC334_g1554 [Hortaea werneckii]KAI7674553.1 hypothetical protein KC318_g1524 [Hortaea werneckii]RMY10324.1 hypothetical protein D0868_03765 [Hortaea werneckii]RMY36586.1 hypothetical protein D0866_03833 [Hortaea werneckii]